MNRKSRLAFGIAVILFLVVAIPASFYYVQYVLPVSSATTTANDFFSSLINDDFDNAFQYVAYFDKASDLPPETPYEDAMNIWVERIKRLKAKGAIIKSYGDLRVSMDDGIPRGSVTVTAIENGREDSFELSLVFTGPRTNPKIIELFPCDSRLVAAISGNIIENSKALK